MALRDRQILLHLEQLPTEIAKYIMDEVRAFISEEPGRGGRLRERVSAVREQLLGTRLNLVAG